MFKIAYKFLLLLVLLTQSCTVANLTSLPKSASEIDFNKCPTETENPTGKRRTSKTMNEYCFEKSKIYSEDAILRAIDKGLRTSGYVIRKYDALEKFVLADRTLRANEWNSFAGIYYKIEESTGKTKIYIQVRITQDITGGRVENRAQKIALIIEKEL